MRSYFLCHGSPRLALERNEYTEHLRQIAEINSHPEAIIIFTAHWESETLAITATDDTYETIYDFGGFSEELYSLTYPAKGSVRIAQMLKDTFAAHSIDARLDTRRGLDHGTWVPLRLMYPKANIPVVQLSVNPFLPLAEQYRIGQALASWKEQNVLIIGSGATVHNLRTLSWHSSHAERWAVEFDDWLIDRLQAWNTEELFRYRSLAPHAVYAVPREEHLVPLFIAMGTGDERKQANVLHRFYNYGTLSHISIEFCA